MRNFFLFGLAFILVFFSSIALSHVPKGVTASDDVSIGRVAQVSRYQVSGDRQGKVTVRDTVSGEVIRSFVMDEGVVVRETFLLDNGRTVGASQKDHAVFWDLATGREIRRFPERIYGFSHDETKFFTYGSKQVFLYAYPDLTPVCKSETELYRPRDFQFSPDDRFVAIFFLRGLSASDESYPLWRSNIVSGVPTMSVFNTVTCQRLLQKLGAFGPDSTRFSPDSRYYYFKESRFTNDGQVVEELWQINLETQELKKVS